MKTTIAIILIAATFGCSTSPKCVLLKFNHRPSADTVARLADTQPASDRQSIQDWFAKGETGFILSATHTNEIAAAIADGATLKKIQ